MDKIKIDYGICAPSVKEQLERHGLTLDWLGDSYFVKIKNALAILIAQELITIEQLTEICDKADSLLFAIVRKKDDNDK